MFHPELIKIVFTNKLMCFYNVPGHQGLNDRSIAQEVEKEENVCMTKTPLIAVMVVLCVALLMCLVITAWMFRRMRQGHPKQMDGFANTGYKS